MRKNNSIYVKKSNVLIQSKNYEIDTISYNAYNIKTQLLILLISILIISSAIYTQINGASDSYVILPLFVMSSFGLCLFSPFCLVAYYLLFLLIKQNLQLKVKLKSGETITVQFINPFRYYNFAKFKYDYIRISFYRIYNSELNANTNLKWRLFKYFSILIFGYYIVLTLLFTFTNNHDFFSPDLATSTKLIASLIGLIPLVITYLSTFLILKITKKNLVWEFRQALIFIVLVFLVSIPFYLYTLIIGTA